MYSSGSDDLIPISGMWLLTFLDEREEDDELDDFLLGLFDEAPSNTL